MNTQSLVTNISCLLLFSALACTAQNHPDLSPVSVGWTGQPVAGQSLTVNMTVTNIGSGSASGVWDDEWFLSTSTTTNGVVPGGSFVLPISKTVGTGGSYTNSHAVTLPDVPAGDYYLIGFTDINHAFVESNTNNNTQAVPITLAIPDLAPVSVSWTGQPVAGQSLTLNMTVTNLGSGFASGVWYDEWFLSTSTTTNGVVAGGSFVLAVSKTVGTNGSYTDSHAVTLPGAPAGNYYLIGFTDITHAFIESDTNNNILTVPITLGLPDLSPVSVSWSGQPVANQSLTLNMTVTNLGSGFASGVWYDEWFLSTSPTTNGVVAGGSFVKPVSENIGTGGSYTVSDAVTLPGVPPGNYYLLGVADINQAVTESNTNNNLLAVAMTITNYPPYITLLTPTNAVQQTSCVPVSFALSAAVQLGSYAITNVTFFDGNATNAIASLVAAPYVARSRPLDHGTHVISVWAADQFGIRATSILSASLSIQWPAQTNVLRVDIFSNTCVVCMTALNGTNYVLEAKTNLASPAWLPLATNQVSGAILAFTNQQTTPMRFYRTRY